MIGAVKIVSYICSVKKTIGSRIFRIKEFTE